MKIITIDGRVGANGTEVKSTTTGKTYARFSLANNTFANGEEKTEWFDIISYDQTFIEKRAQYLGKVSYVIVTGNWETEANVSAKDGKLYINQRVVATDVNIPNVGKKSDAAVAPSVSTPEVQVPQVSQPTINIPSVEARLNAAPAPEIVMDKEADDDLPF